MCNIRYELLYGRTSSPYSQVHDLNNASIAPVVCYAHSTYSAALSTGCVYIITHCCGFISYSKNCSLISHSALVCNDSTDYYQYTYLPVGDSQAHSCSTSGFKKGKRVTIPAEPTTVRSKLHFASTSATSLFIVVANAAQYQCN
jgi:hypothetical protein